MSQIPGMNNINVCTQDDGVEHAAQSRVHPPCATDQQTGLSRAAYNHTKPVIATITDHEYNNHKKLSCMLMLSITTNLFISLGGLTINDLTKVQNKIWEARVQWYNLGLGLDLGPDSLDAIELDNQGKSDRCFRAMLSEWLKKTSRPTWNALAVALKSPSVGYSHLSEEILSENP